MSRTVETKALNGGTQHLYTFSNGWGASVVRHSFSYGREDGLWELAVLNTRGQVDYSTHITDDVIGSLTLEEADEILSRIEALPSANTEETL